MKHFAASGLAEAFYLIEPRVRRSWAAATSTPRRQFSSRPSLLSELRLVDHVVVIFLKKVAHPRPLFRLFSSFQTNITICATNKCEKCPSSVWFGDLNPRPLDHESSLMTTRPWLPLFSFYHNSER